jgi:hypothetical protein
VGKPKEKISLRRPRHMCKSNKMVLKEIGWGGMGWGDLVWKKRTCGELCDHSNETPKHHVS